MAEYFSWTLLYYLSEWIIRVVMLFVVPRKRHPNSAMAWLLVVFFLPWPGLILYLMLGRYRLPRRRIEQHGEFLEALRAADRRLADHPNITHPDIGPHAQEAVKLAEKLGYMWISSISSWPISMPRGITCICYSTFSPTTRPAAAWPMRLPGRPNAA
jgi:cardiolipin synthase